MRGSSSRRGVNALLDSVRVMKEEGHNVVFTPDGPRGPRYKMKPGPIMLASLTGAPICPLSINASRCWSAKGWDGFQIPKPGSTLTLVLGKPIYVPAGIAGEELEQWHQKVEDAMNAITVDPEQ